MTGRGPCSAMRLSICERNYASPFGMLGDKQFIVVNRHSFGGQRHTDPLRRQNDPFSSVPKGSVEQIADGVGGGTGEIADF